MSAPSPEAFDRSIRELDAATRELVRSALRLRSGYRWAHAFGHGTGSSSVAGGAAPISQANPTLNVVDDDRRAEAREAAEHASDVVRQLTHAIRNNTDGAIKRVEAQSNALRSASGGKPTAQMSGAHPKVVSGDELAASRATQRARIARGEGWGDG